MAFKKQNIGSVSFLILMLISAIAFSNPLSGTYTIGGSSPNYASFNAAITDLVANGVSGPVTFNVRSGTYNEQVKINYVTGASTVNAITFQAETGNAGDVVLKYASNASANYVIDLDSALYLNFNEMTVQSAGTTYSKAINLENLSSYNSFNYLIVAAPVVSTNSANNILINLLGDGSACSYNGVYHCTLTGGSFGVYAFYSGGYTANIVAEYNSFINQYEGAINEQRCLHGATIKYNTITTNSTDSVYNAIKISIEEDTVSNNKIYKCPGTGINFNNCSPYISNNFVEIEGSGINYGIVHKMDNYCADKVFVTGNTVLVKNTNSQSAAFSLPFPGYTWNFPFNFLRNNIFVNRGGGYAISLVNTGSVSTGNGYGVTPVVDYNDYYTTGPNIGLWGTTLCPALTDWQSTSSPCGCGADAHSFNVNPSFVSDYDLHITVDNVRGGTHAIEEGPKDIDGDTRNVTTPDMGADELTGIQPLHALFSANNTTICQGGSINYTDNSTGSATGWKWTFSGGNPAGSTSPNPSVTYSTAGAFDVKLVVTNSNGKDSLTKTNYINVNPLPVAGVITSSFDSICVLTTGQLNVTTGTGTIQWQSSANGVSFTNISSANTTTYTTPNLSQTTYYRVKTSNSCGTDSSVAFRIKVIPLPVAGNLTLGRDSLCGGSGVTSLLNANGSSGNLQWQYSTDGISFLPISGDDSSTYSTSKTLTQTTYYRLIAQNGNCNSDTSNTVVVHVLPVPEASFTYASNGKQVSFSADSVLGNIVTYHWDFGDNQTSNEANPVHTFDSSKTYYVCLTVYNGSNCSFTHCGYVSTLTAVENFSPNPFIRLYPNPVNDELSIDLLNAAAPKQIIITDELGRTLIQLHTYQTKIQIDVHLLSAGIYFVKTQMADGSVGINRFVKE